jgi:hypothetical protein
MCAVPLASNARFQSLVKRLEAQMAATRLDQAATGQTRPKI